MVPICSIMAFKADCFSFGGKSVAVIVYVLGSSSTSKHPQAKPGALVCEPLKAAGRGRYRGLAS